MVRHRLLTVGLSLWCLTVAPLTLFADKPLLFVSETEQALADRIDQLIAAEWARKGVKPAAPADDTEFLRRVSLDVYGRIPRVSEIHRFLDDKSPDKRDKLINELLGSALYTNNFTTYWRYLLLPPNNNAFGQNLAVQLDPWLRKKLNYNTPYDQMVRELLTVQLQTNQMNMRPTPTMSAEDGPRAFFAANESKPENLAASTSRLFLGIRLECAQCHDHPFAKWSREDFWQYTAFFAGVSPQQPDAGAFSPSLDKPELREIKIPGKEKTVQARYLDGSEPQWQEGTAVRKTLADWMTAKNNKFFARAAVNRIWAHFFGIGIIDPVDEPADDNPPSHPELLDELARSFADHNFDMKFLMGAILRTKAYQLSSAVTDPSQLDPRLFGRMSLKGLTAEQFFDSVAMATGYRDPTPFNQQALAGQGMINTPRAEFVSKFSNFADRRTEFQTSILQALALMNGKFIADATQSSDEFEKSVTLGAVQGARFMTTEKKIEALFLASLSRKPTEKERTKLVKYVEDGGPTRNANKALGDVFWALLNSSEFMLNH